MATTDRDKLPASPVELEKGPDRGGTDTNHGNDEAVRLVKQGDKFVPVSDNRYRNDLMAFVGYLEFFNALDFPANIWNTIPIPVFAMVLMAVFGTAVLLASTIAALDLRRSIRNVKKLRRERTYLLDKLKKAPSEERWQAWLGVNFREIGWELIDRLLNDILVGVASILVGVGTIMAVGGANPRIYLASNLMSGYIGNGFVAFYGLINAVWSAYLFRRAARHKKLVRAFIVDEAIRKRATRVFRYHQEYAFLNGITLLVSGAGSLISSTMWWGYVILIPCIVSSVYCNYLWRKKVGYNRILFRFDSRAPTDALERIATTISVQQQIERASVSEVCGDLSTNVLIRLITHTGMLEAIGLHLLNKKESATKAVVSEQAYIDVDYQTLGVFRRESILDAVDVHMSKSGMQEVVDQERLLYELLGSHLSVKQQQDGGAEVRSRKEESHYGA